jgi:hypothetical protein
LGLFDAAVPDGYSYSDTAKRIEYIAISNSLIIDSITFSGLTLQTGGRVNGEWVAKVTKTTENNLIPDQLSFSVMGKPQNVITFLKEVENMDRLAELNAINLTKQIGTSKTEDILKATGKLTLYFYDTKK